MQDWKDSLRDITYYWERKSEKRKFRNLCECEEAGVKMEMDDEEKKRREANKSGAKNPTVTVRMVS